MPITHTPTRAQQFRAVTICTDGSIGTVHAVSGDFRSRDSKARNAWLEAQDIHADIQVRDVDYSGVVDAGDWREYSRGYQS
jgi:hypothetical protein